MSAPSMSPPLPPSLPLAPRTSGIAITSLVLGVLALPTLITAIPAVITGHIALAAVKRSGGMIAGRGMAIAGLVLGYLGIALLLLAMLAGLAAPLVIRQREKATHVASLANMRQLHLALYEWSNDRGGFPKNEDEFRQLETAGYVPDLDRLLAMRDRTGSSWKYYPAANSSADPLLISPPLYRGKKILILRTDGSVQSKENTPENSPPAPVEIPVPRG